MKGHMSAIFTRLDTLASFEVFRMTVAGNLIISWSFYKIFIHAQFLLFLVMGMFSNPDLGQKRKVLQVAFSAWIIFCFSTNMLEGTLSLIVSIHGASYFPVKEHCFLCLTVFFWISQIIKITKNSFWWGLISLIVDVCVFMTRSHIVRSDVGFTYFTVTFFYFVLRFYFYSSAFPKIDIFFDAWVILKFFDFFFSGFFREANIQHRNGRARQKEKEIRGLICSHVDDENLESSIYEFCGGYVKFCDVQGLPFVGLYLRADIESIMCFIRSTFTFEIIRQIFFSSYYLI